MARRFSGVFALVLLTAATGITVTAQQAPAVQASRSARVWLDRAADIEQFIRTAPFERVENVPIGVTKPKRAYFAPGGLADSVAWKVLPPSMRQGFWESYKSEIAAYELDKLLGMGYVPPTVEKTWEGKTGAAILWLAPVHPWKEMEPKPKPARWARQAVDMKMFDNLICNKDRNAGNMLIDDDWNLFLIDHTRAFIRDTDLPWQLEHVDRALWNKMLALDEATLTSALGKWLGKGEIRAMLSRRDEMKKMIDRLVKKNGDAAVFIN